jgi:hypothetical protein
MAALEIKPEFTVIGEVRRASSDCCGALLNPGTEPESFTCQNCGRPCSRVLSEPEKVILRG